MQPHPVCNVHDALGGLGSKFGPRRHWIVAKDDSSTIARRVGRQGLTESRITKRYLVAGAVLAGIKIAAVARQLGVSRSWASREANAPGTRNLLAELLEHHRERLIALFDRTLDVIEDAMKARQFLVANRVLVDLGPDHYARLEAVKVFTALMIHASKRTR